jgi:pimeloyl-ACP methyl ester carboxylesterase
MPQPPHRAPRRPRPIPRPAHDPLRPQNPLVSRKWVVIGVVGMLLSAILLIYGCLCLLFWQGQWQLLFHPSHLVARTPASIGLAFSDLRFGATETGALPLDGWWVPAPAHAPAAQLTILYLHGPAGSLSDALPAIQAMHGAGVNVFAFDPRGFGRSDWASPSERRWNEDADAAFRFLTQTRHLDPRQVVLCGSGLGASIAAELTARQSSVAALILDNPQPPTLPLLQHDRRAQLLPVRLLAHDRFDPATLLSASSIPKLFFAPATLPTSRVPFARSAAQPKEIVLVPAPAVGDSLLPAPEAQAALRSFLQQFVPSDSR